MGIIYFIYTHVLKEVSQLPVGWKHVVMNDYHALRTKLLTET